MLPLDHEVGLTAFSDMALPCAAGNEPACPRCLVCFSLVHSEFTQLAVAWKEARKQQRYGS